MAEAATQPRAVFVTRKTRLQTLIERHGTPGQLRFFLRSRRRAEAGAADDEVADATLREIERQHDAYRTALDLAVAAVPSDWRYTSVEREQLDRFLFSKDDFILVVGQDGLVANVAKYLEGQFVLGVNPDPQVNDGVLCRLSPHDLPNLLPLGAGLRASPEWQVQERTMVLARRDDGSELRAMNEIFVGHATHQSARYHISAGELHERHSSSGVIVASGTGSTGWALSIGRQRGFENQLPNPTERKLAWFVREPFPTRVTGTSLSFGLLNADDALELASEMPERGVLFGDGIETDFLDFLEGNRVVIRPAPDPLRLVVPMEKPAPVGPG